MMERKNHIEVSNRAGRLVLSMAVLPMGRDLNVSLYGGVAPHIGAVALAQPRASLKGNGESSASCSVLTGYGHKEDALAKHVAVSLAKRCNTTVCVACGIHLPEITEDEIAQVFQLSDNLIDRLMPQLALPTGIPVPAQ
jgi:hypothetical protein